MIPFKAPPTFALHKVRTRLFETRNTVEITAYFTLPELEDSYDEYVYLRDLTLEWVRERYVKDLDLLEQWHADHDRTVSWNKRVTGKPTDDEVFATGFRDTTALVTYLPRFNVYRYHEYSENNAAVQGAVTELQKLCIEDLTGAPEVYSRLISSYLWTIDRFWD